MLHQVGVSFDLYYDARKHKIKKNRFEFLSLSRKICTSSVAPSTKRHKRALQVSPELWILNIEVASRHTSGVWNFDVAIKFMEYLSLLV